MVVFENTVKLHLFSGNTAMQQWYDTIDVTQGCLKSF